jgi:ATP-dependent DNA helicase RecG
MVIESAEKFGLSQLHQLRGRVGRGGDQSFCILMTGHKLTNDARKRIKTMVDHSDGFIIAEEDLNLRGPGDMEGLQQSGMPFKLKIATLGKDNEILEFARNTAANILKQDPDLKHPNNNLLVKFLENNRNKGFNWREIS